MHMFTSSSGITINGGNFTVGATQVESDDYAQADDLRKRRRSLDGLMDCQQTRTTTMILFHFFIDRKGRRSRPA
jgi:hypothetical protein